ncbi:MAG: hypothetical protein KBA91_04030 [Candidatus Moranbacteria bacterium]|nr:hypothetical protein [Candidatus Moranbacteria bacterium]
MQMRLLAWLSTFDGSGRFLLASVLGVLALITLAFAHVLLPVSAHAADGEFAVLLVPKALYRDTYIPVEVVSPVSQARPEAKVRFRTIKNILSRYFRPQQGSEFVGAGRCVVEIRQIADTNPTYWLTCGSDPRWPGDDGFMDIGHYETPEQVLEVIQSFARVHFNRIRESILHKQSGQKALAT